MKKEPIKGFDTIPPRIKAVREQLRLSQRETAKQIGISPSYFSEIEAGRKKPGSEFLLNLAHMFNINPNFILLGKGEMFLPEEDENEGDMFDFDRELDSVGSLLWRMKRSAFFRKTIMGYAGKIILENEDTLKLRLKKNI